MNNLNLRENNLVDNLFHKFGMAVIYISGYKGYYENCLFMCSIHGEFSASPRMVLRNELGCSKCGSAKMSLTKSSKEREFKNTISDLDSKLFEDITRYTKIKDLWTSMLHRCYGNQDKARSYVDCSVSDEWLKCSKFFDDLRQFENYEMIHNGWQLDKDILVRGNKTYSPETCCFVPKAINNLFKFSNRQNKKNPLGVCFKKSLNKYGASYKDSEGKQRHIGYFNNQIDAFSAYKVVKESAIKDVAVKYKDFIDQRTYEAMVGWEVTLKD